MALHLAEPSLPVRGCLGNCNQGCAPCTLPGVCHRNPLRRVSEADLDRAHAWRIMAPGALAARQRGPRRIAAERQRRTRLLRVLALLAAAIALTLLFTGRARAATDGAGLTVGLHLHTAHFGPQPDRPAQRLNNATPGIYVLGPNYTAGIVRNSHERWSVYAGFVGRVGALDVTVGAITGYQYRHVTGEHACSSSRSEHWRKEHGAGCSADVGSTRAVLRPLLAVSYAFATPYATPRITLLGKGVHLSIEREFAL